MAENDVTLIARALIKLRGLATTGPQVDAKLDTALTDRPKLVSITRTAFDTLVTKDPKKVYLIDEAK